MLELVRESVVVSYKELLAPGVWDDMSEEDRDDAVRVHTVVCHNHLRDTMLRHGIKEELKALKETLAEALEEVRPEDRVTLRRCCIAPATAFALLPSKAHPITSPSLSFAPARFSQVSEHQTMKEETAKNFDARPSSATSTSAGECARVQLLGRRVQRLGFPTPT